MKRRFCLASATCLVLTLLLGPSAWAYDQPLGLNLGYTSFMDGAPPAGPGFYIAEYLSYYTANSLAVSLSTAHSRSRSRRVGEPEPVPVSVGHGGALRRQVGPRCHRAVRLRCTRATSPLPDDGGGLGDVLVGPYLQWDPIMGENGPIFMHRIELQTIWPSACTPTRRL